MSSTRRATHAESWYSGTSEQLNTQLSHWLDDVPSKDSQPDELGEEPFHPPVSGCKAIIAPHAGYDYSGKTAAWAYKCVNVEGIKRVFIIGPSHHVAFDGCALTKFSAYATPLGDLPVDFQTSEELRKTGLFSDMSSSTDEEEHSIELHLPYLRRVFVNREITIVPILVGSISAKLDLTYGRALAPYLASPDTLFVISGDFCRWGNRFSSMFYYPSESDADQQYLFTDGDLPANGQPIHASISRLDHEATSLLTLPTPTDPKRGARKAHRDFAAYLRRTGNMICGRHPIGILLGALTALEEGEVPVAEEGKTRGHLRFVHYEQSSPCIKLEDSSESYVAGYVTLGS